MGSSTQPSIMNRIYNHRNKAKDKSKWKGMRLYEDIDAYGWEHFIYGVIEECDDSLRYEREQFWIDEYNREGVLVYNREAPGVAPSVAKSYEVVYQTGRTVRFTNLSMWCRENDYNYISMHCLMRGTAHRHKDIISCKKLI